MRLLKKLLVHGMIIFILLFGITAQATEDMSLEDIKKQAEQGDVKVQMVLAAMYKNGDRVIQSNHQAFIWFEKAANQGDPLAQAILGMMYYEGSGVRQNIVEARKLFQKSANQGDPEAQGLIGVFYENGIGGIRQNKVIAKTWYGISCDNGSQNGCDDYRKLNEQGY